MVVHADRSVLSTTARRRSFVPEHGQPRGAHLRVQRAIGQEIYEFFNAILDEREKQAAITPAAPEAEPLALPPAE